MLTSILAVTIYAALMVPVARLYLREQAARREARARRYARESR
jgi:hypothetical protein